MISTKVWLSAATCPSKVADIFCWSFLLIETTVNTCLGIDIVTIYSAKRDLIIVFREQGFIYVQNYS